MKTTLKLLKSVIREELSTVQNLPWFKGLELSEKNAWSELYSTVQELESLIEKMPAKPDMSSSLEDDVNWVNFHIESLLRLKNSPSAEAFEDSFAKSSTRFEYMLNNYGFAETAQIIKNELDLIAKGIQAYLKTKGFTLDIPAEIPSSKEADAKLGKIAVPDVRSDLPRGIKKIDPNTPYEEKLTKDIQAHVDSTFDPLEQDHLKYIKQAIEQGWYPKVFKAPESQVELFRGLRLPKKKVTEIFSMSLTQIEDHAKAGDVVPLEKTVKSTLTDGRGSSWTSDIEIAKIFAFVRHSDSIGVILHSRGADNPGKFWDMSGTAYTSEKEVVALDDMIKIFAVSFTLFDPKRDV